MLKPDDLLKRVKEATGPDRELDGAIAEAFGWRQVTVDHGVRFTREWKRPEGFRLPLGTMADPPFFTASLDAALRLGEPFGVRPIYMLLQAIKANADADVGELARAAIAALLSALSQSTAVQR